VKHPLGRAALSCACCWLCVPLRFLPLTHPSGCAPLVFFSAHLLSRGVSWFVGEAPFGSCSPVVRTLLVVRAAPCFGFDAPFGLCAPCFSSAHLLLCGVSGILGEAPFGSCSPVVRTLLFVRAAPVSAVDAPFGLCAPFFFRAHLLSCGVSGFLGEAPFGSCSPVVRTLLVVRAAPFSAVDAPFGLCAPFFFSAHLLSCGVSGFLGEAPFGSCSPAMRTLLVVRAAPCFGFDAPSGFCAPEFQRPLALVPRVGFSG